jgi:ribose transport system ATP-binding protein
MDVQSNLTMTALRRFLRWGVFLDRRAIAAAAGEQVRRLGIRTPSLEQPVRLLSGGNQQKVVIAKWLLRDCDILFFDEPTRGIDVGAKFAIYELMDRLAGEGIGVILISSELPEILGMTDRVAVFHEGRIACVLDTRTTSQEEIMHHASGRNGTGAPADAVPRLSTLAPIAS